MTKKEFDERIASIKETLEAVARKFTTDYQGVQDLVQDTILKALTYRHHYKQNTNFLGWIYTIMRSAYIDRYRKDQRMRTSIDVTEELYYLNIADTHTFNRPDNSYEYGYVIKCIDEVDPMLSIPFKMYMEGFKYHEIASILNIPLGTVKNRIFHARKEIQKKLSPENTTYKNGSVGTDRVKTEVLNTSDSKNDG